MRQNACFNILRGKLNPNFLSKICLFLIFYIKILLGNPAEFHDLTFSNLHILYFNIFLGNTTCFLDLTFSNLHILTKIFFK